MIKTLFQRTYSDEYLNGDKVVTLIDEAHHISLWRCNVPSIIDFYSNRRYFVCVKEWGGVKYGTFYVPQNNHRLMTYNDALALAESLLINDVQLRFEGATI